MRITIVMTLIVLFATSAYSQQTVIFNNSEGRVLYAPVTFANGTAVTFESLGTQKVPTTEGDAPQWIVYPIDGDWCQIQSLANGLALTAVPPADNGADVKLWLWEGGENQLWRFEEGAKGLQPGQWLIRNKVHGHVLDGSEQEENVKLGTESSRYRGSQAFRCTPAPVVHPLVVKSFHRSGDVEMEAVTKVSKGGLIEVNRYAGFRNWKGPGTYHFRFTIRLLDKDSNTLEVLGSETIPIGSPGNNAFRSKRADKTYHVDEELVAKTQVIHTTFEEQRKTPLDGIDPEIAWQKYKEVSQESAEMAKELQKAKSGS